MNRSRRLSGIGGSRRKFSFMEEAHIITIFSEYFRKILKQVNIHDNDDLTILPYDEFMLAKGSAELSMGSRYGYLR